MWKARAPARTEMSSQKCKVQGMSQNRTLSQGMPVQEKRQEANLVQAPPLNEDDTHINENGVRQPNPSMVNMLKIVNHIGTNRGPQGRLLKFPIATHLKGSYKHHLVVRVDTGADVNCMNEKTFNELFPEVELSVCPHEIQNFGNSVADISILGQFHTYLQFSGEKYLNTFIVTNANDCPNLLSYGATFRMGVLLPNYPEENVVRGEIVPKFKVNTSEGTSLNVFQILQDLCLKQYQDRCYLNTMHSNLKTFHTVPHNTVQNTAQPATSFRTTTPSTATTGKMTTKQVNPVHGHPDTSCKKPLGHCTHVHQPTFQVCRPGESLALRKVKHPYNGRTSVNRLSLTKQDILSQYSSCFEGIGCFPGDLYKFHLKPEHKPTQHAPRKVPIHLESAFKEEIKSLVKLGILEEVKEHTDWVNSYVIVEKDHGNHHSPNHAIRKKLRICLDPRDLNEALEREPYHTHSVDEIPAKFQSRDNMEPGRHFPTPMEKYTDNNLTLTPEKIQTQANTWHFTRLTEEHFSQPYRIPTGHGKHAIFPREPVPARKGEIYIGDQPEVICGYMYIHINIHIGD